tara:strand:+ start:1332 stop:1664 length:333 start_codon:yes stop_codon:yes gene_type:complete
MSIFSEMPKIDARLEDELSKFLINFLESNKGLSISYEDYSIVSDLKGEFYKYDQSKFPIFLLTQEDFYIKEFIQIYDLMKIRKCFKEEKFVVLINVFLNNEFVDILSIVY